MKDSSPSGKALTPSDWAGEAIIRRHIDLPTPQPRALGPFALAEQAYGADLLQSAGFSDIKFDAWAGELQVAGPDSTPESAARFVLEGMQIADLIQASGDTVRAAIQQSLIELFERHTDDAGVRMEAKAWLVCARA